MSKLIGTIAAALVAASKSLSAYGAEQGMTDLEKQRRTTSGTPDPKDLSTGTERGARTVTTDCSKLSGDAKDNCLHREWLRKQRKLSDGPPPPDAKPAGSETMRDQAGYSAASKKGLRSSLRRREGKLHGYCLAAPSASNKRRDSEGRSGRAQESGQAVVLPLHL